MEVKIQIPDNCELIKDGDTYIVKEKKQPPRSWKEFCEKYPLKNDCFIRPNSTIESAKFIGLINDSRHSVEGRNWCISKEEAEAFLALMQLRQLRKAWVDDWEQPSSKTHIAVIAYSIDDKKVYVESGDYWSNVVLSFPTTKMAKDFLNCFKDLCETAKILL